MRAGPRGIGAARLAALVAVIALGASALVSCDLTDTSLALTVTTVADGRDASPGDGVCEMTVGVGDCSVRAAVDEANASPTLARITVPSGTYHLTAVGTDDSNAGGDLDLDPASGTILLGSPAPGARLVADGADGALDVRSGFALIVDLAVTGASGPGLDVGPGARANFTDAASFGNGGPGVAVGTGGDLTTVNATFADNAGAGIDNAGAVTATYATVTANGAGGVVNALGGLVMTTLTSSLVVEQSSGADCTGQITSLGFNQVSDGTCRLGATQDVGHVAALLDGLSPDLVPVHAPGPASRAHDGVPTGQGPCTASGATTDQLGRPRPQGTGCDIGAFETDAGSPVPPLDLEVNSPADGHDSDPGDGICATAGGVCTLRAAVDETNVYRTIDHIRITPGVAPVLSLAGRDEDGNATGDLDILQGVSIDGAGATVSGGGIDRVIDAATVDTDTVTVTNLTVTGGSASRGGGIRSGSGRLTLSSCTVRGNHAEEDGGGVLANNVLDVSNCTFEANVADQLGGGVEGSSHVTITGSTFRDNRATSGAGAVVGGVVSSSTFTGNVASSAGGALVSITSLTLSDSTLTGNSAVTSDGSDAVGGAIQARSHLDVVGSTVDGNTAVGGTARGGGIAADQADVGVVASLITDNRADEGGGVWSGEELVGMSISTISGNHAPVGAAIARGTGGCCANETAILESTITGNDAGTSGSSLFNSIGTLSLTASLVDEPGIACGGPGFASRGYNVVSDATCGLTGPADLQSVSARLGPLADNGGPTRSHLPQSGSPAIDRLPFVTSATFGFVNDQRNVFRGLGSACDSGSVEAA